MCEYTYMQMQRSAAQRSAAHHMLRLEATSIYSAAQRMCERTFMLLNSKSHDIIVAKIEN